MQTFVPAAAASGLYLSTRETNEASEGTDGMRRALPVVNCFHVLAGDSLAQREDLHRSNRVPVIKKDRLDLDPVINWSMYSQGGGGGCLWGGSWAFAGWLRSSILPVSFRQLKPRF